MTEQTNQKEMRIKRNTLAIHIVLLENLMPLMINYINTIYAVNKESDEKINELYDEYEFGSDLLFEGIEKISSLQSDSSRVLEFVQVMRKVGEKYEERKREKEGVDVKPEVLILDPNTGRA